MSMREKAQVLRLIVTILGRLVGQESILLAAMTNHCRSLITIGAAPVLGLDECPILTKLSTIWHHVTRLRAYGKEQWACRWQQKAHHARQ